MAAKLTKAYNKVMAKISVIIPTYNRAQVLARALDSVSKQSFTDVELIVVDDGSVDDTKSVCEKWCANFAGNFIYLRTENRGVSAARNLGADKAQAPWLAFLDSDDEWLPHKLESQWALTQEFAWIHGEEVWIRDGVRVNASKKYAKSGGQVFRRCVDLCFIAPSSVLVKSEVFRRARGFREDFPVCEDYELWLRLAARYPVGFVKENVLVRHGGHADQLSRRFRAMDFYRARALLPLLQSSEINDEDRQYVAATLIEKCEILIRGYLKHDNLSDLSIVQDWLLRARSAVNAVQIAHSAIDLRPRSEFNGIL